MLAQLQTLLSDLYALDVAYDVHDFLITDERLASVIDSQGRLVDEKLLIAEDDDGSAGVSLYLQAELLERLQRNNPARRLDDDNLQDFWTAMEGISHFVYYAWNADLDKSVTLLEMELQAEVDKFIATSLLLQQQGSRFPAALHEWLFARAQFDEQLTEGEMHRYRDANRYAGKYCRRLVPELSGGRIGDTTRAELCRFYRFTQPKKIEHIERS